MKNLLMKSLTLLRRGTAMLVLMACVSTLSWAQSQVSGVVTDGSTNEPIPGVNVLVKGTTTGTITDIDGKYTISAPSDAVLVYSFIGYETAEEAVAGRTSINVVLKSDSELIDEVVAVGYGFQRKSDLTGSVAKVSGDDIQGLSTTDAAAALQGKAAGVQIINSSGKPGQGASIRVRGYSSNSDKIGPLLIVDGLQVSSIQYLDPELIESMEVLKDAASAAIYGAEAGNGVVLITTKSGSKHKGEGTITYSGKWTNQSLGKVPELLNASEFIEWMRMLGEPIDTDMETAKNLYGWNPKTDTDWLSEFMANSWSQQHSLSFAGGNDRGNYFLNINYVNQDGIVKGKKDVYERLTGQINADYKVKDWLQVGTNTSIEKWRTSSISEQGYGTAFEMLLLIDPLTPVYWDSADQMIPAMKTKFDEVQAGGKPYAFYGEKDADGNITKYYATSFFNQRLSGGSPFIQKDRAFGTSNGVNINGSVFANLTPFDFLTVTSRFGYRLSFSNNHGWNEPYYVSEQAKEEEFNISADSNNSIYYQWENFANFNKTFNDVHNVGAMVGMAFRQTNTDGTNASAKGQDIMNSYDVNYRYLSQVKNEGVDYADATKTSKTTKNIGNMPGVATSLSYFGRLSYSYDSRYNVQFNFRSDAFDASKLAKKNRWGNFPSVSAGWTISNEGFMKDNIDSSVLSFLKVRGSWGRNGNVNILSGYKYATTLAVNSDWYQSGATESLVLGSKPNGVANPNLKWETSEQVDLGLDARFLSDRLTVGLDYYRKLTKDLLVNAPCLPESGVSSMVLNAGEVENKGFELEATWKDKIGDLSYSVSANFATLKNEVTYLAKSIKRMQGAAIGGSNYTKLTTQFEKGEPIWYMYGYKYLGKNEDGSAKYYDKNNDGIIDNNDRMNVGYGVPDVTYGITLNLAYKGVDFTLFGTGAAGNDIYYGMYREGYSNCSRYFYDEAKKGNLPKPSEIAGSEQFWSSTANIFDGSYFKIKQMQLGYTLPKAITSKAFIQALRCYISLDDFFTFTSYPGLDPETAQMGSNGPGMDSGAYPTMRKMVLGVNVTF
ncbi:MAG: SusC/RagA family TonB-linked outer membrane protein [Bacteroidales bacterium]|nr:SusC/RagA family TonB-linked outer membrane protein [Bacteroidales bacterium]